MAADKPQPNLRLLEHLYPDEVDPGDSSPGQVASSEARPAPGDAAEFAEFEAMLAQIRREDFGEDVPPSLHASVIAAAREHTQAQASRAAQVTRRAPHAVDPTAGDQGQQPRSAKPLWARVKFGVGGQLALVATVMLVAGVLFVQTQVNAPQTKYSQANSEVVNYVTFDGTGDFVPENRASTRSAASTEAFAQNSPPPTVEGEAEAESPGADLMAGADKAAELAQVEAQNTAPTSPESKTSSGRSAPESDTSSTGLLARLDDAMTSKRDSEQAEAARTRTRRRASRSASSKAMKKAPVRKMAKDMQEPTVDSLWGGSVASSAEVAEVADEMEIGEEAKPAEKSAPAPVSPAPEAVAKAEQKAPSQLDSIEESFTSAHYDEVLVRADAYAKSGAGTSQEKAQALEYKARAQSALGKDGAALDTYEQLQSAHPNYKKDHISAQIARLRGQHKQAPMRREAAPSRMQFDSAAPTPSAEPQSTPTY